MCHRYARPYHGHMALERFASLQEWSEYINAVGSPATADDQCKTWDGAYLTTKADVLAHLKRVEAARKNGRDVER